MKTDTDVPGGTNMNVFEKLRQVKGRVADVYPSMDVETLKDIVQFLANNWHGTKKKDGVKLTQQQLSIYELLMKNGYSPTTVYKWLLVASSPQEIRDRLRNNELSIREALKLRNKAVPKVSVDEKKFLDAIIRCIEVFVSDAGENYPGRSLE